MKIEIVDIQCSPATQARVSVDEQTVQRYAAHLEAGGKFPPSDVFFDGTHHWLADGWHRLIASQRVKLTSIQAEIHTGTERDAMIFALGANSAHGLPRSTADKRKAVQMALEDSLLREMSSRELADICKVSHNLVAEMRKGLSSDDSTQRRKKTAPEKTEKQPPADEQNHTPPEPHEENENEELRNAIQELHDENERLKDSIAVGRLSSENQTTAADIIRSLRDKLRNLEVANSALTVARDQAMNEVAELKSQCQRFQRELKALKGK